MARVLLWSNAYWPLIGGVEILGDKLVSALAARGHEFVVITDCPVGVPSYSLHNGVAIHRLPMIDALASSSLDKWLTVRAAATKIKREFKPSLVWNYLVQFDCIFHRMTHNAWPVPTMATIHGVFHDDQMKTGSAVRDLVAGAEWVTACSEHALAATVAHVPSVANRSSVIWNALEMPEIEVALLPFSAPRLLCLGRMQSVEEKGFDVAISAMPEILNRFPAVRLQIAGDGAARTALEVHAANTGVAHAVDFLGWLHPDQVPASMNAATVVLMPSRVAEGFGLVALQGQQMARPVVASRVGGISTVVIDGETGLLVAPGDSSALAHGVIEMLQHPERATQMGIAGRKRAMREFSFAKHVDAYDALLTRITTQTPETAKAT